jgi:hypothetical protein
MIADDNNKSIEDLEYYYRVVYGKDPEDIE